MNRMTARLLMKPVRNEECNDAKGFDKKDPAEIKRQKDLAKKAAAEKKEEQKRLIKIKRE